jgi:hypothetical protein
VIRLGLAACRRRAKRASVALHLLQDREPDSVDSSRYVGKDVHDAFALMDGDAVPVATCYSFVWPERAAKAFVRPVVAHRSRYSRQRTDSMRWLLSGDEP